MSQLTLRDRIVGAFAWALLLWPVGWAAAESQGQPPTAGQVQEEFLEYRLRPGESLGDVARLFHLSVEELAQINRITDPTRLQAGQPLKVPNGFARQAAQLQGERNRLLAEKEQTAREMEGLRQTRAALEAALHRTEEEKTTLTSQLAATPQWQRGALALAVLLLGIFGWGLKLRGERAKLTRKLTVLMQENTALTVAKEKYRQAVAQVELRYQKLYSARAEVPAQFVAEGTAILARSFAEGCTQMEQLLTNIKTEREKEEQILQAEQQALDRLFHPLRGLLQRHRLKYHGA